MRLWTIHPSYLDGKGLVAAWREGLLAQKVLAGQTGGYRHHPQLDRFRTQERALDLIARYLVHLEAEASIRGYHFDASRILSDGAGVTERIGVHNGQIVYEMELLRWKLKLRDLAKFQELIAVREIKLNPVFAATPGGMESWERPIPELVRRIGPLPVEG